MYLFLPCDEIPVVNQPLSQLLWYVHLDLLVRGRLTLHRKYIIKFYTNLYKAYRKSFVHHNYYVQDSSCTHCGALIVVLSGSLGAPSTGRLSFCINQQWKQQPHIISL